MYILYEVTRSTDLNDSLINTAWELTLMSFGLL